MWPSTFLYVGCYNNVHFLSATSIELTGIILCMGSANEKQDYIVTSLIGWARTLSDPCVNKKIKIFCCFNERIMELI